MTSFRDMASFSGFPQKFSWLNGTRCLVTGAAGFIGSHLCDALLSEGAKVTVIDNLSTGKRENIPAGVDTFHQGSITDEKLLTTAIQGAQFVFHLAAIPAVPRSIVNPLETFQVNLWGTQMLLEKSRLAGVSRLVFSSSSSVYGGIEGTGSRNEKMTPSVLSPYAAQKLSSEALCIAYAKSMSLSTVCLRYFNIFGPRQSPESDYAAVIPKFLTLAMRDQSLPIHGNGDQMRDFTPVKNAVYMNLLATRPNLDLRGEVFNVGCGSTISLNQLIAEVEALLGRKVQRQNGAPRAGDVFFSLADIEKAKKMLNYSPVSTWQEGLKALYQSLQAG